jgi:hypothetical protein
MHTGAAVLRYCYMDRINRNYFYNLHVVVV